MIELAGVLTDHPDATQARASLASIAEELLKNGADATIAQAIEAAPCCTIAQTLQHAVEAASERVVVYRNGLRTERLLFAIPIITTFGSDVPESQFESALSSLNGSNNLAGMKDGRAGVTQTVVLPKLFTLHDLNTVPLSVVRERGINLGTGAGDRHREWIPSTMQERGFKRSTAFLRFLVGQRMLPDYDSGIVGEEGLCERLEGFSKQAIKRYLGRSCHVRVTYTDSFHEGLYSGMWLYQETRLDQLAHASCAETRSKESLEARIATYGCRHRFEIWVGFFAGDEAIGGHVYRLGSRPSEDPHACVSRITSRLEAAGIKANAFTNLVPEERGFGQRVRRKIAPPLVMIPI
jgi:hypothetical protein